MAKITREHLWLAALAAGIKADKSKNNGGGRNNDGFDITGALVIDWHNGVTWRPHLDDGDAARLAVRLGIRVTPPKYKCDGSSAEPTRGNTASCTAFRADPVEQTCIAITLCAAEIGRKMKENKA